ncbi:MAG: hypothetical protein ACKVRN_07495 [Pyrinomonadaceae bacterium]
MKENALEKKQTVSLKEKTQYSLTFGVIAVMLYYAGFPIFLLLFIGVLSFFIWKVFSIETQNETRRIFEFYLSANEILREDDRRWYGFEIQETIQRGEAIIRLMSAAPPLVYFALGALYQKLEDHSSAVKNLTHVAGESASIESAIVYPAKELREYVRMLRKIERAPAEAPLTSSAVRALERARKNKGEQLLEYSRSRLANTVPQHPQNERPHESVVDFTKYRETDEPQPTEIAFTESIKSADASTERPRQLVDPVKRRKVKAAASQTERKSISEVLHDIYDKNNNR